MTTSSKSSTSFEVVSDLEIVMTRVFDAPRELVFEACTQARHMSQWWGPRDFSMLLAEMDARPGGTYRFVQRAPDGSEHPFHGQFSEVVAPERVAYSQVYEPVADHPMQVSVTFEDLGQGRTRLVNRMRFDSVESRDATIASGMEGGARQSYARLSEHLETMQRGIFFERVFEAPRELVFDVWTNPSHVGKWWGPTGFTNTIHEMDVRPGGVWRFIMHGPDGVDYPNRIVFVEVIRPERLVYDHGSDDDSQPDFRSFVHFADEGPRTTRVSMRTLFPSAANREIVVREYHAEEGMREMFQRLRDYLQQV